MINTTNAVKRKLKLTSRVVTKAKKICEINDNEGDDSLTLLNLNDDCLLHIFGYLKLTDVLNVSEVCEALRKVSHEYYKRVKYYKWKGYRPNTLAMRIFSNVGQHLVGLWIDFVSSDEPDFIAIIRSKCSNLKCVKFSNGVVDRLWVECLNSFECLESLTFSSIRFNSIFPCDNWLGISTLKEFQLHHCFTLHPNILGSVAQCNVNIERLTFEYVSNTFDLAPVVKMSNLKSLCLYIYPSTVEQLDFLHQLNGLMRLKITSKDTQINIDGFLTKMAETGALEELEIIDLYVSNKTFTALGMMKLKSLNIDSPKITDPQLDIKNICLRISNTMPDLRHLTLSFDELKLDAAVDDLLLLIERLELLEELNVFRLECPYGHPDHGYDIPMIIQEITYVLQKNYRPKLKLMLPWAITAELFDSNGRIHEKYRSTVSKLVHFTKPSCNINCNFNSVHCVESSSSSSDSFSSDTADSFSSDISDSFSSDTSDSFSSVTSDASSDSEEI